jgi:hypothetical protein
MPDCRFCRLASGLFLLSAVWACIGIPLWLAQYGGAIQLQTVLPQSVWHAHEMTFGFATGTVAGLMLTASTPLAVAEERYGGHFQVVMRDL